VKLKNISRLITYMAEDKKQQEDRESIESLINLLAKLAADKMYGPLDVLGTAPDISIALSYLYTAIRYAITQSEHEKGNYPIPTEDDINKFVAIANRNPEIMREIAIKALIRAEKMKQPQQQTQQQSDRKESKQVG
jgi:hypothetical protein